MALETPLYLQPSVGDAEIDYTAQQERVQFDIMSFLSGVTLKNDLKVTQRALGANMSVDVAPGSAVIAGGTITYQGKYLVRSTAVQNVTIGAAPGSGTRTDLVVARVYDNQADGLGAYVWQLEVFPGSTVPIGASYIPLAKVAVASTTTSVTNAIINDSPRLLNTLGDVPAWELNGGSGQPVATFGAGVPYTGWSFSDLIGCDTTSNAGEIKIRLPGRYQVTWTARIDHGGDLTQERNVFVTRVRGASTRRVGSQCVYPGSNESTQGSVLTASGGTRCLSGDLLRAFTYQASGQTLHLNDFFSELEFSGYWIGP